MILSFSFAELKKKNRISKRFATASYIVAFYTDLCSTVEEQMAFATQNFYKDHS